LYMVYISSKVSLYLSKGFLTIILVSCFVVNSFTQEPVVRKDSVIKIDAVVKEDAMVQKFYAINHESLYWFSTGKDKKRANEWLTAIESSDKSGIATNKKQIEQIRTILSEGNSRDNIVNENTDKQITGLVLKFIKALQESTVHFEYSEVKTSRDSVYIYQLMNSRYKGAVSKVVSRLDCKDHDYQVLKKYIKDSIKPTDSLKYKKIALSMNYLRFLSLNHQSEYILANIPTTDVEYFRNNKLVLKMRSVVGKKKNPTPTIASYITDIVTFPFWNVPYSIASKEFLPKVQKNESFLERNNLEVVDAKGNIVEDSDINWDNYTEKNFPYFFRGSTGPNNSLGVLKFNLVNPFSIYLHDTNSKGAFAKDYRFLSHGCIRLEKPVELADLLTKGKIDIYALKTGKKDTESKTIRLPQKVPVFIVYMPVTVNGKQVTFLKDVYGLIK